MIDTTNTPTTDRTRLIISGTSLVIALLLVLFFLFTNGRRPLKPLRPSDTANLLFINNEATFVTFIDLNADPLAYLNQFIRVSGRYTPQPLPDCLPHSGPNIRWALINDDLQLGAIGFEAILREVPEGTILTVDGIWRRYHGPLGCGKQPPNNQAWYLEVTQIIEPNPLFGADSIALDTILGPSRTPFGEEPPTVVPGQPTTAITATQAATATSTFTPTPTVFVTGTPPTAVGTATPTSLPGTPTPSRTPTRTPTATPTSLPGTPSRTPTITPTPTPGPVLPTIGVATPDPYQGPNPTSYP